MFLGDDRDFARIGDLERERQAGDARSDGDMSSCRWVEGLDFLTEELNKLRNSWGCCPTRPDNQGADRL